MFLQFTAWSEVHGLKRCKELQDLGRVLGESGLALCPDGCIMTSQTSHVKHSSWLHYDHPTFYHRKSHWDVPFWSGTDWNDPHKMALRCLPKNILYNCKYCKFINVHGRLMYMHFWDKIMFTRINPFGAIGDFSRPESNIDTKYSAPKGLN